MRIRAAYPGTCARCGGKVRAGALVDWDPSTKLLVHPTCPEPCGEQRGADLDVPKRIWAQVMAAPRHRRASLCQAAGYYPEGPRPWAAMVPIGSDDEYAPPNIAS